MIIIVSRYLIPNSFKGFTFFPFVVLKERKSKGDFVLLHHERIHLRQQLELLILPFFIWYGLEFLVRLVQFNNWKLAYRNISFEREAYENDDDFDFLKNRSFFNFMRYL